MKKQKREIVPLKKKKEKLHLSPKKKERMPSQPHTQINVSYTNNAWGKVSNSMVIDTIGQIWFRENDDNYEKFGVINVTQWMQLFMPKFRQLLKRKPHYVYQPGSCDAGVYVFTLGNGLVIKKHGDERKIMNDNDVIWLTEHIGNIHNILMLNNRESFINSVFYLENLWWVQSPSSPVREFDIQGRAISHTCDRCGNDIPDTDSIFYHSS